MCRSEKSLLSCLVISDHHHAQLHWHLLICLLDHIQHTNSLNAHSDSFIIADLLTCMLQHMQHIYLHAASASEMQQTQGLTGPNWMLTAHTVTLHWARQLVLSVLHKIGELHSESHNHTDSLTGVQNREKTVLQQSESCTRHTPQQPYHSVSAQVV